MSVVRRDFLTQVAAAATCGLWGGVPTRPWRAPAPDEIVPEVDEMLVRALALVAVETARGAGATFADVRVSGLRGVQFGARFGSRERPDMYPPYLRFPTDYGIRALVDGAWGFAGGYTLTPEAVAEVARTAVARARANRPRRPRRLELAPVPRVEHGTWATPIARDPFAVPIGEQADLILAALAAAQGVRGVTGGSARVSWQHTLNVFASSEGSLVVQRFVLGSAVASVVGKSREDHEDKREEVPEFRSGGYGYEAVIHAGLDPAVALRRAAERAVAGSAPPGPPPVSVDVGRYDIVLGPGAVRELLSSTLVPALNLERALGYHANGAGTSFAAPPAAILGQYQVGSPLVTLRADRTRPHATGTVGWDDEGAPAGAHTLIDQGVIVDYLTSRQTAVELAPYYASRGEPVHSRACTVGRGQNRPEVSVPNLTLEPGRDTLSLDDLVADTKRGFYVADANGASDQQLLSGQFKSRVVREIRAGKLGRPIKDFAFQFLTPQFWKKADALGGPDSLVDALDGPADMRVVPMRVREVNVLNTGITL